MSGGTVFADRELVELLGDKPDLLAIADAIAAADGSASRDPEDEAPEPSDRRPSGGGRGGLVLRRPFVAFVVAVFTVVVLAAPALAVSPRLRELVGLSAAPARSHVLVARVTRVEIETPAPRYAPPLATVSFTVGEAGKAPGTGVPDYSVMFVSFLGKREQGPLIKATGAHGRYRATLRTPVGGITDILVGGFLNTTRGSPAANGDFWIPVINAYLPE